MTKRIKEIIYFIIILSAVAVYMGAILYKAKLLLYIIVVALIVFVIYGAWQLAKLWAE